MIYAYLSPLFLVVLIFVSTIFVIDWLTKLLIYVFIINLVLLPGLLLFKEEVMENKMKQPTSQEGMQNVEKNADSE